MLPPIDFTSEKYKRLIARARERGEPIKPLVRRLVLETIEQVRKRLTGDPNQRL